MKKQHRNYEPHLATKTKLRKGYNYEHHYNAFFFFFGKIDKAVKTHTKSQKETKWIPKSNILAKMFKIFRLWLPFWNRLSDLFVLFAALLRPVVRKLLGVPP